MSRFVTAGIGPVPGKTTLDNAWRNVEDLLREAGIDATFDRDSASDAEDDGRYDFIVHLPTGDFSVRMPGLPKNRVKCDENENVWSVPRLYVDGNSWEWSFAVEILQDLAAGES